MKHLLDVAGICRKEIVSFLPVLYLCPRVKTILQFDISRKTERDKLDLQS